MFDVLRQRMAGFLSAERTCILTTTSAVGPSAIPVRYRVAPAAGEKAALVLECLLPRWAEAACDVETEPRVLLTILDHRAEGLRWLQYRGRAQRIAEPAWAELWPQGSAPGKPWERFVVIRVTPARIDLLDESQKWGSRETLDL